VSRRGGVRHRAAQQILDGPPPLGRHSGRGSERCVGVANVDQAGSGRRVKGDAEGLVEAAARLRPGRLAVGTDAAEDLDLTGFAFGQEKVALGAVRSRRGLSRFGGVERDLEALGRWAMRWRGGNEGGTVVHDSLGRGGHVGDGGGGMPGDSWAASVKADGPDKVGA